MADKPAPGPTAVVILLVFLAVLAAMFFLWLFTGGPERYKSAKPFTDSSLSEPEEEY